VWTVSTGRCENQEQIVIRRLKVGIGFTSFIQILLFY